MITVILGTPPEYRLSEVGQLADLYCPEQLAYDIAEIRRLFEKSVVYPDIEAAHAAARKLGNDHIHYAYLMAFPTAAA